MWRTTSTKGLSFFPPIYFQLYHQVLLFYKGIYFVKDRVTVTYNNNYVADSHFIKSSNQKQSPRGVL